MNDVVAYPIDLLDKKYLNPYPIRPNLMTAMFLNLTRHYFTKPEYLSTPRFKSRPNVGLKTHEHNSVKIVSAAAREKPTSDKVPSITIRRLEWAPTNLGVGDNVVNHSNDKSSRYSISFQGSHLFICRSLELGELEFLVEEVMNMLIRFRPVVRLLFNLQTFNLVLIEKPSVSVQHREYFTCPLAVKYIWTETWEIDKNINEIAALISQTLAELGWPPVPNDL
ncbi:MAG: hypothetical protein QW303_01655 [Nitrososphaerota archaeon]